MTTKKKGVAHLRAGLAAAIDSSPVSQPQSATSPPKQKSQPVQPASGLRGSGRADEGEAIEKITITLPASIIQAADEIVFQNKRQNRAFNRSALIQKALQAYLNEL